MAAMIEDPAGERQRLVVRAGALAAKRSLTDVEVYQKRGRSRLFAIEWRPGEGVEGPVSHQVRDRHEVGWAVRYGNKRGRGFACGCGDLPPDPPLVAPRGNRLLLPQTPGPEPRTEEPPPLISETQALRALTALAESLPPPLVDRRLHLQDGRAASLLANNHGLSSNWFHSTGLVTLEEWLPGGAVVRLHAATSEAAAALDIATRRWSSVVSQAYRVRWRPPTPPSLDPGAGPDELDDQSATAESEVAKSAASAEGERVGVVLAPEAVAPLIAEALAAWSGEEHGAPLASPVVQVCDGPDWPRGPMSTAIDGQGDPAVRRTLVQRGRMAAGLADPEVAMVRRGWRDSPVAGYLQPVLLPGSAAVDELIAGVGDGWWLAARVEVPASAAASRPAVFLARRIRNRTIDRGSEPRLVILHTGANLPRRIRELAGEIRFQPVRTGVIGVPAVRAEGVRVTVV